MKKQARDFEWCARGSNWSAEGVAAGDDNTNNNSNSNNNNTSNSNNNTSISVIVEFRLCSFP